MHAFCRLLIFLSTKLTFFLKKSTTSVKQSRSRSGRTFLEVIDRCELLADTELISKD